MKCYECDEEGHIAARCPWKNDLRSYSIFRHRPGRPPTAAYLAEKAKLKVVNRDGEIDPARLHGPDLARWQVAEARSARGQDLDQWMEAAHRREREAMGSATRAPTSPQ